MNAWLRDHRVEQAEIDAFNAERAEKRGDFASAREQYRAAGNAFASVSLGVSPDYPNTRADLSIAATACYARAGDLGQAIEFAERILAETDALTEHGRTELRRLGTEYAASPLALHGRSNYSARAAPDRGQEVRKPRAEVKMFREAVDGALRFNAALR